MLVVPPPGLEKLGVVPVASTGGGSVAICGATSPAWGVGVGGGVGVGVGVEPGRLPPPPHAAMAKAKAMGRVRISERIIIVATPLSDAEHQARGQEIAMVKS